MQTSSLIPMVTPSTAIIKAKIVRVIDRDTSEVDIKGVMYNVRYIGMDILELSDASPDIKTQAQEATSIHRKLVESKVVKLEKDVSETDRYSRLVRYVYIGDLLVNNESVRLGYAQITAYPRLMSNMKTYLLHYRDKIEIKAS